MNSYLVPRARRTLAREGAGDPRVLSKAASDETHKHCVSHTYLVGEVPDGDTNTALDVHTRLHDALVVLLLLREVRLAGGRRHADVELRDRDLDAERGELLQHGLERCRHLPDDEVALEADTVYRHALLLERLDEVEHRGRLRARLLDVVVVDVQLRVRVCRAGGLKCDGDVGGVERVVEDVRPPGTIVVEWL